MISDVRYCDKLTTTAVEVRKIHLEKDWRSLATTRPLLDERIIYEIKYESAQFWPPGCGRGSALDRE